MPMVVSFAIHKDYISFFPFQGMTLLLLILHIFNFALHLRNIRGDRVCFEQIVLHVGADKNLEQQSLVNTNDPFRYGLEKKIVENSERMERSKKISRMLTINQK
jgi:hypothetical protein